MQQFSGILALGAAYYLFLDALMDVINKEKWWKIDIL